MASKQYLDADFNTNTVRAKFSGVCQDSNNKGEEIMSEMEHDYYGLYI